MDEMEVWSEKGIGKEYKINQIKGQLIAEMKNLKKNKTFKLSNSNLT